MTTQIFDVVKLVDHFGGRSGIHAKLVASGMKLTVRAVDQWLYRERIPSAVLATLIRVSIIDGRPLNLAQFTCRSDKTPRSTNPDLITLSTLLD
jgi:hypothetical protein